MDGTFGQWKDNGENIPFSQNGITYMGNRTGTRDLMT